MAEQGAAAQALAAGKITPVFARFSTVACERGSTDTARDIRGGELHHRIGQTPASGT